METLIEEELDGFDTQQLVVRMDEILSAPYFERMGREILKLNVQTIYETEAVKRLPVEMRRKAVYKAFSFLLQLTYTEFSSAAQFFQLPEHDADAAKQLHWAARSQWISVSSRIGFEYFMQLTYMLGTGQDFPKGKSAIRAYRKWLKEPKNRYTYFAISAARAKDYDRTRRSPEVHAGTKLARRVLLGTATDIDNANFELVAILKNQWQFVLDIANDREPNGWAACGDASGDKEWYELWEFGDQAAINEKIDEMFTGTTDD